MRRPIGAREEERRSKKVFWLGQRQEVGKEKQIRTALVCLLGIWTIGSW